MKRIFSTKESRRSSVSAPKPSKPAQLQYFTYDDVAAANEPRVGKFPQHGDTVALGPAEAEAEAVRSRASKRASRQVEDRDHEDIFANAPEEPLAPEGPSRRSLQGSRRSSRRMSRRGSSDASAVAGPSSSRNSRAISPERGDLAGGGAAVRSSTGAPTETRVSRRTSEPPAAPMPEKAPAPVAESTSSQAMPPTGPSPAGMGVGAGAAALAARAVAPSASATPPGVNTLSQVPTASDSLSRIQTRVSSGPPSRQSVGGSDVFNRRASQDTSKSKTSRRVSKRSSKPEPLKYFLYDDVAAAEPPSFKKPAKLEDGTEAADDTSRHSRSVKGKEREAQKQELQDEGRWIAPAEQTPRTPADPPQVPELPQKLSHMDMSGTGLSRQSTSNAGSKPAAVMHRAGAARNSAPSRGASATQNEFVSTALNAGPPSGQDETLAVTHGLDFSDIPASARPPPVNMATKPPSKQPSREFKNGAPIGPHTSAGGVVVPNGSRAAGIQPRRNDPAPPGSKHAQPGTLQEQLPLRVTNASSGTGDRAAAPQQGPQPAQAISATGSIPTTSSTHAPTLAQIAHNETFIPVSAPFTSPVDDAPASVPVSTQSASMSDVSPSQPLGGQREPAPVGEGPDTGSARVAPAHRPQEPAAAPSTSVSNTTSELPADPVPQSTRRRAPPPPKSTAQTAAGTAAAAAGAQMAKEDAGFNTAPSSPVGGIDAPFSLPPGIQPEMDALASQDGNDFEARKDTHSPGLSAPEVIERAKYNSNDTTVTQAVAPAVTHETVHTQIKHIREERITREVHTYDVYHRIQPIVDIEVLSTRHFLATQDGGLVEISGKDLPTHMPDGHRFQPNWIVGPEKASIAGSQGEVPKILPRQFSARKFEGTEGDHKEWTHPDGYPVTDTTWVHPPSLETGASATGQTVPFHFDHESGHAGFLPPGVPAPGVTRTTGSEAVKTSVERAGQQSERATLTARPMKQHSQRPAAVAVAAQAPGAPPAAAPARAASQALRPVPQPRAPSEEHLSSQNI